MKSMHMRATTGKYDVSMYSISFHSDLSRIFRSAGFIKNIFCCFLCSLLSNEYINEGKKISFLCVSIGAFCVISNTFWSNTTSIRTIWLNARKWELIAICKIWYEFLKILQFMKFSSFKSSPKLCRYLSDSDDHILVQESDGNRFRFCKVFKEIFLSKLPRRRIISCL